MLKYSIDEISTKNPWRNYSDCLTSSCGAHLWPSSSFVIIEQPKDLLACLTTALLYFSRPDSSALCGRGP